MSGALRFPVLRLLAVGACLMVLFGGFQSAAAHTPVVASAVRPGATSPSAASAAGAAGAITPSAAGAITPSAPGAPATSVPASVDDGASTRLINRIIGALGGMGVVMLLTSVWLWRSSRPVAPHLEGLDLITKRRWLHAEAGRREDLLGTIREGRGSAPPPKIVLDGHAISSGPAMPVSPSASDTSLGAAASGADTMVSIVRLPETSPLADPSVPNDLGVLKVTPRQSTVPPDSNGPPEVDASYGDTHG